MTSLDANSMRNCKIAVTLDDKTRWQAPKNWVRNCNKPTCRISEQLGVHSTGREDTLQNTNHTVHTPMGSVLWIQGALTNFSASIISSPLFLQGETHAYKTQVSQLERLSYHTGSQISWRITRCELDDKYWHSMTKKHSMITVTLDDKLAEVNKTSSKKTVTLGDKSGSLRLRPTWNIWSVRREIHNSHRTQL